MTCTPCLENNHQNCTTRNEAMRLAHGMRPVGPACWCDCPGLKEARDRLIEKHDLVMKNG